jgi:hypothetical protein
MKQSCKLFPFSNELVLLTSYNEGDNIQKEVEGIWFVFWFAY